jgi:PAS domain S-box-containing protein/putative nucleotidyltransferase with HDIG domain
MSDNLSVAHSPETVRDGVSVQEREDGFFRVLFQQSPDCHFLLDPSTRTILRANEAACAFYGYADEAFRGMPIEHLAPLPPEAERMTLPGRPRTFCLEHRLSDGTLRSVEAILAPVVHGGRLLIHGAVRDRTREVLAARKLRERALRESTISRIVSDMAFCRNRAEYRRAIDRGLAQLGRLAGVNRAYAFLKSDPDEDGFPDIFEWTDGPDTSPLKEELASLKSSDFPWWFARLKEDGFIQAPDVEELPPEAYRVARFLLNRGVRSITALSIIINRRLMGFIGISNYMDGALDPEMDLPLLEAVARVTGKSLEVIMAKEALEASEARFQDIVETQADLVCRFSPSGEVTFANPAYAAYYGGTPEDHVGRSLFERRPRENQKLILGALSRLTPERPVLQSPEERYVAADGAVKWQLWTNRGFFDGEGRLVEIQAVGRDITRLKLANAERDVQRRRMLALFRNSPEAVLLCLDGLTINDANESFCRLFGVERASLTGRPVAEVLQIPDGEETRIREEMIGRALAGETVTYEGTRAGPGGRFVPVSILLIPVRDGDAYSLFAGFRDLTLEKTREADLSRNLEAMKRTFLQTVHVLSFATEARDPYTAGHQRRVAHLAAAMARRMGHGDEFVEALTLAATVHDIGKIVIPAEILSKPSALTTIEMSIVRQHCGEGYRILSRVDFPWNLAEVVRQHHERLDGSGYPRGLRGNEILPEARILAVADVMEAVASHRPYRPAMGVGAGLEVILGGSGTLFDPDAARACAELFRSGYAFPAEGDAFFPCRLPGSV